MAKFSDYIQPDVVKEQVEIDGNKFEIEFRYPKWVEVVKAETNAVAALKERLPPTVDANGNEQKRSLDERRLLTIQTGLELASMIVSRVDDTAMTPAVWDKLSPTVRIAIGGAVWGRVWQTEVGAKNS